MYTINMNTKTNQNQTNEICYFCKCNNIIHENRKCMNGEIGTFRKCLDCHAGDSIEFDSNAQMEVNV